MSDHLSEAEIQQYVLDEAQCPVWMGEHVGSCERCALEVNNYRMIFGEVARLAPSAAEGSIADLVLAQLGHTDGGTSSAVRTEKDRSSGYWLAGAAAAMAAAGWVVGSGMLNNTGDMPSLIIHVVVGGCFGIGIVRALDMVSQYRRQLKNIFPG